MSYSVLYQPVLNVKMLNGERRSVGIYDAFRFAQEIDCIDEDNPLERYAVLRLLIAFAMDVYHPIGWINRQEMLEDGSFDLESLDHYIKECERVAPRFDLFDKQHPFMQAAQNAELDSKAVKPVAALSVTIPSGNNHVFLDHRLANEAAFSVPEAFRAMLTIYLFCTAGAQGYPSGINNTPPVFVWVNGSNLYETIILNSVAQKECSQIEYGIGDVPWRKECSIQPKEEVATVSMLQALTWQPRRITLLYEEDGMIRNVLFQQGKNFRGNGLWFDPHVPYRMTKENGWTSLKPQSGRALWRDLGCLLLDREGKSYRQPLVLAQVGNIIENRSAIIDVSETGLVTNNAAYLEWMEDRIALPSVFMSDQYLSFLLREDVGMVETVNREMYKQINKQFSTDKRHDDSLSEQASLFFLARMHDEIFGQTIPRLISIRNELDEEKQKEHRQWFIDQIIAVILETFTKVVNQAGMSAAMIMKQNEAFRWTMNKVKQLRKESGETK